MKNYKSLSVITAIGFLSLLFSWNTSTAQLDACDSTVPYYYVDLTGQPEGAWISPQHSRLGDCCDDNICTSFEVILDSNAAALSFDLYSGAVSGSMFFQIDCGSQQPVKKIICLSGVGPHEVTFCKPGSNENEYIITSIAKPTFPIDVSTRLGCSKDIEVLGFDPATITWSALIPAYDTLLSCTEGCSVTTFTADDTISVDYIDIAVCGFPQADECGYVLTLCDTFRINIYEALTGGVSPNPATFCQTGPGSGVDITATATGGDGNYSYTWLDANDDTVQSGINPIYYATSEQNYTLAINDGLSSSSCAALYLGASVIETSQPVVDAGDDQLLCPNTTIINLIGTVDFATGGIWSGGLGAFSPDPSYLSCNYSPTASEIASGLLKLYLTSTGAGGSCSNVTDSIQISFPAPIIIQLEDTTLLCNENKVTLTPVVSGGIETEPYNYLWSNGYSSETVNVGIGNYCIAITDDMGCINNACVNVTAPNLLSATMSSTPASADGASDGDATAVPSGGTAPYQYSWLPGGGTTSIITNLSYGVYTVTITDDNGCDREGSIVVNEPRCLSFDVTTTFDTLLCHSDTTATAIALATGGTPEYSYLWNDDLAQTNDTITNLSAGLYSVTVTDVNNCFSIAAANIIQPVQLVNTNTTTNASTVGGSDGTATANPFGGETPYSYLWSNTEITQTINGLTAGPYYITITDDNSCNVTDSSYINEPPCNNFMIYSTSTSVTCNGSNDGTANVFVVGGVAPYSISWSTGETTHSIKALSPDDYTVEVTDAFNCYSFNTITITEPDLLETAIISTDISCNGLIDGTADLTVSGGTYPYAYNWSNSNTSEDLVYLGLGLYKVTVTDKNFCVTIDSLAISEPTQVIASHTQDDVTCYGDSTAAIDVTVSGGIIPYSYIWSNGETTQDISGIPAGLYWAEVRDANNCLVSTNFNMHVTEPEPVTLDSFFIHCPIPGDILTIVDFYPIGGTAPYEISVDSGNTYLPYNTYSTSLNIAENHYIMINDSNACNSAYIDEIQINSAVVIDSVLFDKCYLDTQIESEINVFTSGGTGGLYQISFDNGSTYGTPGEYSDSLLINNEYYIIAMDSANCLSLPDTIIVPDRLVASTSVISNYNGQDISCYGNTNGVAQVTQTGGEGPYSYLWSNGQTNSSAINLGAETYTVTVTDNNGCIDTDSITLTQPDTLYQTLVITSDYNGADVSCYGYEDGSVDLTSNGGTEPYSFIWSNLATSEDLNNIGTGTYTVQITDINGCMDSNSIIVTQPDTLSQTLLITSDYNGADISCYGVGDGSTNASPSGGTTPYTYLWSNDQTDDDATNLGAGTYSVTTTDVNGCVISNSITLTQPNEVSQVLTITSDYNGTDVSCYEAEDGSVNTSPSGGTAPFSYLWSNGQTNSSAINLDEGTYSVTTTDVNGCFISNSITLTQPDELTQVLIITSDYNGADVSCYEAEDGSANTTPSGGTAQFSYLWSNGQTNSSAINLGEGTYSVQITDINGCIATNSITLTQPDELSQTLVITSDYNGADVSCYGYEDGSVDLTSNGGTEPYSFIWSNLATSEDLNNIGAGTYTVQITDINGCMDSNSIIVTQPDTLSQTLLITSDYNGADISCYGVGDGSTNVSPSGGTTPYTYLWSNDQTDDDASNLGAEIYFVTTTDANGCVISNSITLTQPNELSQVLTITSDYNGTDVSCYEAEDGSANTSSSGGTVPYTYLWSNDQTDDDATNLGDGTYSVTTTDVNGCIISNSITLTQPDELSQVLTITSNYNGADVTCYGAEDGSINTSPSGGTAPYTYLWSNDQIDDDAINLGSETYSVTTTDVNGCIISNSITLTQPDELTQVLTITSDYNGTDVKCYGYEDGSANTTPSGGTTPYSYIWSNEQIGDNGTNLGAGTHSVTTTDINGCIISNSITLIQPDSIELSAIIDNVECNAYTDGAIDLEVKGGVNPYQHNWSTGATTEDISNLGAATYSVITKDLNLCEATKDFNILEENPIIISSNHQNVSCNGLADANIHIDISGGVSPYGFSWINDNETYTSTNEDLDNLSSGTYYITVTDIYDCSKESSILITQPDILNQILTVISDYNGADVNCYNSLDGSANSLPSGGTAPYTYLWSNGQTDSTAINLGEETYSVIVTDNNDCIDTNSITLTQPEALWATIEMYSYTNGHNISLYQHTDGSINLEVTGGTTPYYYEWSNEDTTQDLSNIGVGTYLVTITDINGCEYKISTELSEPLDLKIPTAITPNGDGKNDDFHVNGLESYPNNRLVIFNRWGDMVYEKSNYNHNDKWKGNDLPAGNYYVILDINSGKIILTGFVEIIR